MSLPRFSCTGNIRYSSVFLLCYMTVFVVLLIYLVTKKKLPHCSAVEKPAHSRPAGWLCAPRASVPVLTISSELLWLDRSWPWTLSDLVLLSDENSALLIRRWSPAVLMIEEATDQDWTPEPVHQNCVTQHMFIFSDTVCISRSLSILCPWGFSPTVKNIWHFPF